MLNYLFSTVVYLTDPPLYLIVVHLLATSPYACMRINEPRPRNFAPHVLHSL